MPSQCGAPQLKLKATFPFTSGKFVICTLTRYVVKTIPEYHLQFSFSDTINIINQGPDRIPKAY